MTSYALGEYFGAFLSIALFGALIAWASRKIFGLALAPAYALGVIVVTLAVIVATTSANPGTPPGEFIIRYLAVAPFAFLFLWLTARRKRRA